MTQAQEPEARWLYRLPVTHAHVPAIGHEGPCSECPCGGLDVERPDEHTRDEREAEIVRLIAGECADAIAGERQSVKAGNAFRIARVLLPSARLPERPDDYDTRLERELGRPPTDYDRRMLADYKRWCEEAEAEPDGSER